MEISSLEGTGWSISQDYSTLRLIALKMQISLSMKKANCLPELEGKAVG
jgi:hypothetical protein